MNTAGFNVFDDDDDDKYEYNARRSLLQEQFYNEFDKRTGCGDVCGSISAGLSDPLGKDLPTALSRVSADPAKGNACVQCLGKNPVAVRAARRGFYE